MLRPRWERKEEYLDHLACQESNLALRCACSCLLLSNHNQCSDCDTTGRFLIRVSRVLRCAFSSTVSAPVLGCQEMGLGIAGAKAVHALGIKAHIPGKQVDDIDGVVEADSSSGSSSEFSDKDWIR